MSSLPATGRCCCPHCLVQSYAFTANCGEDARKLSLKLMSLLLGGRPSHRVADDVQGRSRGAHSVFSSTECWSDAMHDLCIRCPFQVSLQAASAGALLKHFSGNS